MRRGALVVTLVLVAGLATTWLPCGQLAFAITGCCKERSSLDGAWQSSSDDLERCKQKNQRDKDNVFDASGYVWWDLQCQ